MAVSIQDLCAVNFARRPFQQQLQIVAKGRPLLIENISAPTKKIRKQINPLIFGQVQWLTYCEQLEKFFCWPCLLFQTPFYKVEIKISADVKDFLEKTKEHEITEDHLPCSLQLQMFISKNFQSPFSFKDKVGYNYAVKKNREMFKSIIDAICCVIGQNQFDSDDKYSSNLISIKDCKNFLQLLKDNHPRKVDAIDGAVDLMSSNPRIVNHLVDAMTRSLKISIKNETKKSTYVSIILSQHGSNRVKSQLSTVLRYINGGKIYERFIGFTNHVGIQTEDHLMKYILKPIEEYDIENRFLAFSLDGEISYCQWLSRLVNSISSKYRYSYFVPWYSHGFGYVLLQTLSLYTEFGFFLKMIAGMKDFFGNEKYFKSLDILLRQKIHGYSKSSTTEWNLHSNFIVHVAKYRRYFIEFFGNIVSNSRCQKNGIVAQAMAFRSFLQQIHNVFVLKLISEIFSVDFDKTFNFRLERYAFNPDKMAEFKRKVSALNLRKILRASFAEVAPKYQSEIKKCEALFNTLTKHLCCEVDVRSTHLYTRLNFCDIFDALRICPSDSDLNDIKINKHFHLLLQLMMDEHGMFFCYSEIRVEMSVINNNPELRTKTVHELLEYFAQFNLKDLFPQSYKLLELILTLPYLPSSRPLGGISKLEDIRKLSCYPEEIQIPSGDVSVLSIEYEMLKSLRHSSSFHEDVLARFCEVNRTIPLLQI